MVFSIFAETGSIMERKNFISCLFKKLNMHKNCGNYDHGIVQCNVQSCNRSQ